MGGGGGGGACTIVLPFFFVVGEFGIAIVSCFIMNERKRAVFLVRECQSKEGTITLVDSPNKSVQKKVRFLE